MKSVYILIVVSFGLVSNAWPQGRLIFEGQIAFSNLTDDIDAPAFDIDCSTRLGSAFRGQVYAGSSPDLLQPWGASVLFIDGYIPPVVITAEARTIVYTQLRAWEVSGGGTFEEAVASGRKHGFSNIVPIQAIEPPGPAGIPTGLQSFCLVPEPSTIALLLIAGVLLGGDATDRIRKSRKR